MATTTQVSEGRIVVSAAVLTACIVIGLTAYAFYTKTDFTMLGGMLFLFIFILIGIGLLSVLMKSM
jgi:FtsH-binding integral membrane protein